VKYDGYRTLCFFDDGAVRLVTRNGLDWTARYAALAKALAALPCESALLDGEIVVQDPRGVATLDLLERALSEGRSQALTFYAFDLCHLDGYDLTGASLLDRKQALHALIAPLIDARSPVQFSEHIDGDGADLFAHASRMGIEGVVSKRADSRYVQERSPAWIKVKRVETDTLTIIGYTTNAPKCVAALILADETEDGLVYRGRAGSGISDSKAHTLFETLSRHDRDKPVTPAPRTPQAHWIEPVFQAEIGHRGRSASGAPRQPVFMSLVSKAPPAAPRPALKPKLVTDRDLAGVRLTNPDREMFEGSGVTKLDVALHYARVGDWMLPELMRRPVTIIRCTTGREKDCFYQRHAFNGLPEGVERFDLADEEGVSAYITITKPKGLLALPQFGAVEFHLWGCRVDDPERPDRIVLDLDPDPDLPWARVCDGAEILRDRLIALGLTPFLRTTGGKGVHLVLALQPQEEWPIVKSFAEAIARSAEKDHPDLFVANMAKARRKGRIFIDYLRNGRAASAIASYSLRSAKQFPVAVPIDWSELRTLSGGDAFDRGKVVNRLETLARDPWDALEETKVRLSPKIRRAAGMKE
jgi:bifunctional non-homologous end joining protein LigD